MSDSKGLSYRTVEHIVCIYSDRRPAIQTARRGVPEPPSIRGIMIAGNRGKRGNTKSEKKTKIPSEKAYFAV